MALRNMTLSDVDRLGLDADADRTALTMDEDAFRGLLRSDGSRAVGVPRARHRRSRRRPTTCSRSATTACCARESEFDGEAHRRHYLFRVATNLVRDRRRRPSPEQAFPEGFEDGGAG